MKDALVEAALAKVNEVTNRILDLKASDYPRDYPSQDEPPGSNMSLDIKQTYEEAVSEAVAKAIKTVDALRAALKVLEPEEYEFMM